MQPVGSSAGCALAVLVLARGSGLFYLLHGLMNDFCYFVHRSKFPAAFNTCRDGSFAISHRAVEVIRYERGEISVILINNIIFVNCFACLLVAEI